MYLLGGGINCSILFTSWSVAEVEEAQVTHFTDVETEAPREKSEITEWVVAQRLRICLPMQGTQVRSLVREDPTCLGTTKPVHHS